MGCSLSSCSCSKTVPNKEECEADPSLTTRSKSLTNRSTDINTSRLTPTNHIHPNLKKLNLTNLTQLQSDRSFTSRILNTTNSELKDKVSSIINVRNGKSFMMLLKEINFSFKIIQKLDKIYSNSLLTNELNSSYQSDISKDSKITIKVNKKKSESIENFTHFKSLFYIPLISLSGEIDNFFELSKEKDKNVIIFESFTLYFDYYETFFAYLVNLFQALKYNQSYKDEFLKISTIISEIQKISISFNPKDNITKISFLYISDDFFLFFFGEDMLIPSSKSIDKESMSFLFSRAYPPCHQYDITYKNINLSNKDFLSYLYLFLKEKANNDNLLRQYHIMNDSYMRNCGFVVSFSIEFTSDIKCIGYIVKIKTNHDWLVESTTANVNSSYSSDDVGNWNVEERKSQLKINSKCAQVKYLIISVNEDTITISYEYACI